MLKGDAMTDEIMTVAVARERYQLSKYKMTALIKSGAIPVFDNPRDGRSQLVKASDVVKALQPPQGKPKTRPRMVSDVVNEALAKREATE
jgi:hypothetical protein